MLYDVTVDHEKCGEGLATVLPGVRELPDERILEVARLCPMDAIVVRAADGSTVDL